MRAERVLRHGNELVAGRRAGRLDPVVDAPRPRDVALAFQGAAPERHESQVVAEGRPRLIVRDGVNVVEAVRAAELRRPRRADEMQQGRFLEPYGVPRGSLEPGPARGRIGPDGGAAYPLDHRQPPIRAARTRSSLSHSLTTASKASGRSSIGAWPQFGRYTSCDPGMPAWKRSATSGGVIRSSLPHTIRVGTRTSPSRSSRLCRFAARATRSTRTARCRVVTIRRIASTHSGVTSAGS